MKHCEKCGVALNGYNHSEELEAKRILLCNKHAGIKPKIKLQTAKEANKILRRLK